MRALAAAGAAAAVVGVAAGGGGEAAAEDAQGGAWLHYELTGLTVADEGEAAPGARELVLAGARLHGFLSWNASVAYHLGLDLAAGGTIRGGGLAYDVALFPIGVVVRAGESSIFGAGAGVGASGATCTLDDALTFPL